MITPRPPIIWTHDTRRTIKNPSREYRVYSTRASCYSGVFSKTGRQKRSSELYCVKSISNKLCTRNFDMRDGSKKKLCPKTLHFFKFNLAPKILSYSWGSGIAQQSSLFHFKRILVHMSLKITHSQSRPLNSHFDCILYKTLEKNISEKCITVFKKRKERNNFQFLESFRTKRYLSGNYKFSFKNTFVVDVPQIHTVWYTLIDNDLIVIWSICPSLFTASVWTWQIRSSI